MKRQAVVLATWAGRWTFKVAALVGAFVLIVFAWLWDASLLTKAADENLALIKEVMRLLPRDWSSKVESALRIFGADRALLLVEAVAVAKLLMLGVAYPFRRR
jgi:low affinity Fe/Cu permease